MKRIYYRMFLIVVLFIIAIAVSAFLIYRSYAGLNEELVSRTSLILGKAVEDALLNIADENLEKLTASEKKRLRTMMRSMTTEKGSIIHILLINDKMKILLSSDKTIEGREYKSPQELENLQSEKPLVLRKILDGQVDVLDVIIPLKNDEGHVFSYLRLVLSRTELINFYKDLSYIFIPLALFFAVLIGFAFYFVSRVYKTPLESVKNMARHLDEGDYSYRINYTNNDEFTDTFSRLNQGIEKVSHINESYKKTERRIATLIQSVDDSILLLDSEGHLSTYNDAVVTLFRCPDDMDFHDYFHELKEQTPELKRIISAALRSPRLNDSDDILVWLPDGSDLLTRLSWQVLKEEERVSGLMLSFKNLHLLNELQNNLQRSMKFGVIANLASSISHEIKNPLSAMAIHAEILNNRIKKLTFTDADKVNRSLNVLQNEVKRLNRIINQFFNLARVKQTDLTLISINSVIKDVLFLVQQQAIERNVQVDAQLDEQLDFIYGDPDQLKQVILNLVINGFQAIGKDGALFIRTHSQNKRIFVEIHDSGKGMEPEEQKKIFDLYFTTKKDGGGIGLAVSKNIMHAHDGRITFESVVGKGTKFVLDFPRKDQTTQVNIPTLKR